MGEKLAEAHVFIFPVPERGVYLIAFFSNGEDSRNLIPEGGVAVLVGRQAPSNLFLIPRHIRFGLGVENLIIVVEMNCSISDCIRG